MKNMTVGQQFEQSECCRYDGSSAAEKEIYDSGYVAGYHDALIYGDPVEPDIRMNSLCATRDHPEMTFFCGACGSEMVHKYSEYPIDAVKEIYKFCHHCGRKVLWR